MKHSLLLLALCVTAHAAPPDSFFRALHIVETSGKLGPTLGDYVNGKPQALGPLQIHKSYHADSRVAGDYSRCADLEYSKRVATAYLQRYAPQAWAAGNIEVLARVHNGGPKGAIKPATKGYAVRVQALMKK
jgi:hypothetical protein